MFTVDGIDKSFTDKLLYIGQLVDLLLDKQYLFLDIIEDCPDKLADIKLQIDSVIDTYAICLSPVVLQYNAMNKSKNKSGKRKCSRFYQSIFLSERFNGKLDNSIRLLKKIVFLIKSNLKNIFDNVERYIDVNGNMIKTKTELKTKELLKITNMMSVLIQKFNKNKFKFNANKREMKCRDCNVQMIIAQKTSELTCDLCGITEPLIGEVFEDHQFLVQESRRPKNSTYSNLKHYDSWIARICARENKDVTETVNKIKELAKKNGMSNTKLPTYRKLVTSDQIRIWLKQIGEPRFYINISLLKKELTGVPPPYLSTAILDDLRETFKEVINIFKQIKPKSINKSIHTPYIIYKILEWKLRGKSTIRLLTYIYLQKEKTLIKHDKTIWEPLCKIYKKILYTETNRDDRLCEKVWRAA